MIKYDFTIATVLDGKLKGQIVAVISSDTRGICECDLGEGKGTALIPKNSLRFWQSVSSVTIDEEGVVIHCDYL
jgi:hypothetical protein